MSDTILVLQKIKKTYETGDTVLTALFETDLVFEAGKLTLIMGPSGSGKTTLLSIIGCVIYPTSGTLLYRGQNLTLLSENQLADIRLNHFGFVFQQFNLIEPLNALDNVMQPLLLQGIGRKEAGHRAKAALETVGLGDRLYHLPRKLSGGQKQRAAIARALVTNPAIVLCDEPTASLDGKSSKIVLDELQQLARQGKAVLIVTHDTRLEKYADEIIYVQEGNVWNKTSN